MGQSTFKGGAHPYEGKELSMDSPIREMDAKEELVFPMSQHIGAPATPVVAVGDTVKMGQIIGEASGFISANIVSSVSGEVKAVEPRLLSSGAKATCVVIANDGEYQPVEGLGADRDYTQLTKEEIPDGMMAEYLLASAACFATWNFAVKHLGAVVTSTYIYLVPALTGADYL